VCPTPPSPLSLDREFLKSCPVTKSSTHNHKTKGKKCFYWFGWLECTSVLHDFFFKIHFTFYLPPPLSFSCRTPLVLVHLISCRVQGSCCSLISSFPFLTPKLLPRVLFSSFLLPPGLPVYFRSRLPQAPDRRLLGK